MKIKITKAGGFWGAPKPMILDVSALMSIEANGSDSEDGATIKMRDGTIINTIESLAALEKLFISEMPNGSEETK